MSLSPLFQEYPELAIDQWIADHRAGIHYQYTAPRPADAPAVAISHNVHHKGERRVAWNLLKHLERAGFVLNAVFDGEERTGMKELGADPHKAAMELIFNLDEVSLRFVPASLAVAVPAKRRAAEHGVLLVLGNSPEELVADWNFYEPDSDGFDAAMNAFDAEDFT